jgi:hypothetical protein
MFQGTMLRSTLLTAYAFSVFAIIALWSMIACFILGLLMLLLTLLGLRHYRRVDPHVEIPPKPRNPPFGVSRRGDSCFVARGGCWMSLSRNEGSSLTIEQ